MTREQMAHLLSEEQSAIRNHKDNIDRIKKKNILIPIMD